MEATVKAILALHRKKKNGEYPIWMRITKDRKTSYASLGMSIDEKLWDEKAGLPKTKHPLYSDFAAKIIRKINDVNKFQLQAEGQEISLSREEIIKKVKKTKSSKVFLYDYFQEVIDRLKNSGEIKNSAIYRDTRNNLKQFDDSQLNFSDIDYQFLKKWEEYLKKNGKGLNTIYIYLRTFRAFINKAIKEEVCEPKYYAFKTFSLSAYTKIETKKRAIGKDDIHKVRDFNAEGNRKLMDAKNAFMFGYYCRGINFIDICYLKYSNITGNQLSYVRRKTGGLFNMKLLQPAIDIIEYYRPLTFKKKDSYIFPFFYETHVTEVSKYNRHKKMLRQVNENLKTIASKSKIDTQLTTYVSRHSYATQMRKTGNSTLLISESMGHSSEKVTKTYLESFENAFLDEANESLL